MFFFKDILFSFMSVRSPLVVQSKIKVLKQKPGENHMTRMKHDICLQQYNRHFLKSQRTNDF